MADHLYAARVAQVAGAPDSIPSGIFSHGSNKDSDAVHQKAQDTGPVLAQGDRSDGAASIAESATQPSVSPSEPGFVIS
jgi:hypothetical protein